MSTELGGVTVALVTPLDEERRIDHGALERLLGRVVAGGVAGVSPTGSTGEGARLTRAQRAEMTRLVREHVPAELPVVPGVPLGAVDEGPDELAQLAEHGATAALVAPPHYYPASDAELVRLYTALADRSPVPLLLYNIPMFTKVRFAPTVVAELAAHPNVAGIKDSSRDIEYYLQVIAATEGTGFTVLTGSDTYLLACLLAGGTGAIAASANLVPELSTGIHRAVSGGDIAKAQDLQRQLSRVIYACRAGALPAGWKSALAHLGVCQPYPARPAEPLDAEQHRLLAARLDELGVR